MEEIFEVKNGNGILVVDVVGPWGMDSRAVSWEKREPDLRRGPGVRGAARGQEHKGSHELLLGAPSTFDSFAVMSASQELDQLECEFSGV